MPAADLLLTTVLLGVAAVWTWAFVRNVDRGTLPEDCWPLVPLDQATCTIADEPDPASRATENLYVVAVGSKQFWACATSGCRRVHRTRQGAEFCSLMEFDYPSYTRPRS